MTGSEVLRSNAPGYLPAARILTQTLELFTLRAEWKRADSIGC